MSFRTAPDLTQFLPPRPLPGAPSCAGIVGRVQRLAAALVQAPVARVLLDDRAIVDGCPLPPPPVRPLLAEVLSRNAPLVITDRADVMMPALADAMRSQAWQSLAAVPLVAPGGTPFGALVVADAAPREWGGDQVRQLGMLASLATDACAGVGAGGLPWVRAVARREANDARRKNEERLALIFSSTADLIFLMAVEGADRYRCVAVNDAYLAVTGLTEGDVVGRLLADVLPAEAAGLALPRYAQAIAAGEPVRYDERVAFPLAEVRVETTLTPIMDDDGGCAYVLGVSRDVSARHHVEHELRLAKESAELARATAELHARAAEEASQAKTDFLSRMSHELRTPLNSVIGFANVLRTNRGGRLDARDIGFLERIVTNGEHLLSIINDLLDIARIESGKVPLVIAPLPLAPLVRTTIAAFEPMLAGRSLTLSLELPPTLQRLNADATRLQQVLTNLVGNAVKFTEAGHVVVRVVADASSGRPLRIEIEDTGIGIADDRQSCIFDPFEQADSGTARAYGGTGLGLAISRSLCQLMGFALSARSELGAGSVFTIDLAPSAEIGERARLAS